MPKLKLASDLQKGDKVIATDTGEVLTVKAVGHGLISGHISITHQHGFSEVARSSMVEIA